ncbi:uncharacterized protein N7483_004926 [Penicillium malachiteum]|uniref:uncharacterized protein n=1 Tax=Penicillium malachiteum TaxID=1324776 RepID=UPI0025490109|nr:uncharacterized protein N7483_004926 [Penicillium malachiteum]KAJ5730418.1 hypothetical protein N7483_004926 [Penicillium malachiteum]
MPADDANKGESAVPKFGSFKLPPGTSDKAEPSSSNRHRSTRERTRERDYHREPESRSSRRRSRDARSTSPRRSYRSHNEKPSDRHSSSRHRRHEQPESSRQSREQTRRREHRTPAEPYPPSEYSKNRRSASPERYTHKTGALRAPSVYGSSSLDGSTHATSRFELESKDGLTGPDHVSQADSSTDSLFVIDLVGDPDIHKYGRKKRWNVPNYSLFGAGYVLGLGSTHRIDRNESRGDYVVLRPTMATDSVFKGPERDELYATRDTREIGIAQRNDRKESLIPSIVETMRDSLFSNQNHWSSQLFNRTHFDHLDATADFVSFDTDDIDPSADTDQSHVIDPEAEERVRDAALSRAAEENPEDVSAWLRFIDHQDVLIPGSHDESHNLTQAEQCNLSDKKLFIYEKALRKVGKSSQKDCLLLGRLQVGAQIWDRRKVLDQWKATLRENPGFIGLWVKYLDFFQADSPNFILHQCIAAHMESLRIISSARSEDTRNSLAQVYVFLRLTILYRDAGYNELAVGLWQALFEFSYFKPESVENVDDALSLFNDFWESETIRIGEIGAKGWESSTNSDVDPVTIEYSSHINDTSLLESWIESERERMDKLQMPSRSLDGTTPPFDDPYNIVLYSDVREVLRLFDDCQLDSLINAFLCFCQLPILTNSSNIPTARLWSGDSFVRNELVEDRHFNLESWMSPHLDTLQAGEAPKPTLPFMYPLRNFLHNTDTLFAHPELWFSSFQPKRVEFTQSEWIQRTLQLLISRHSSNAELTEYCLALEFAYSPKSAKKFAKTALKERPTSLRLWNALAMMEIRSNSRDKALAIWSNALSNSFSWPPAETLERSIIWQSWAWQYVEQGEKSAASYILHNVGAEKFNMSGIPQQGEINSSFSATATLRTQKHLRELQGQALASKNGQAYVAYTDCLGLVYYLTEWPFKAAIDVYTDAVSQVEQLPSEFESLKALTTELLHQARARLIWDRIKNGPKMNSEKPTEYRELLEESIALFRHNTMFSTICMWNESRVLRIERLRVDKLLQQDSEQQYKLTDVLSLNEPISNTLLPIWLEMSSGCGESWRVRTLFETALAGVYSRARANLTIWKLYMIYELDHVKDMTATKTVFQRAIQACPWSKELIMFGFEKLRGSSGLSVDELRQLLLVLGDRQLRLRLDIRNEVIRQAADEAQADQEMHDAPSVDF